MPEDLIPHLFRTEFRKITSVLCKRFGISFLQTAEDIVGETFLVAAESWNEKGIPDNPQGWLYTVARNKATDHFRRQSHFREHVAPQFQSAQTTQSPPEIDLSPQNIADSQLEMMFAVCHPAIPPESQIGLSLRILCGFSIGEIAEAFLTSKATINKRLLRAKEKLRQVDASMTVPSPDQIKERLDTVLLSLYLIFNEGYASSSNNLPLRKDLCLEAMRLVHSLTAFPLTNLPPVSALLALMCFHSSRFESRMDALGSLVAYEDQNPQLWDQQLIQQGEKLLNASATGNHLSRYHLEAAIGYWHTRPGNNPEKWEAILQLYNQLLQIAYSPIAALNRTYALFMTGEQDKALLEAKGLNLEQHQHYHALLGHLNQEKGRKDLAISHFENALLLTKSESDRNHLKKRIAGIKL